jgi:hypothetical protein
MDSPALQIVLKNSDQYHAVEEEHFVRHSIIYKSAVSPVSTEMHKSHHQSHPPNAHVSSTQLIRGARKCARRYFLLAILVSDARLEGGDHDVFLALRFH